jgi:hypothetical protein
MLLPQTQEGEKSFAAENITRQEVGVRAFEPADDSNPRLYSYFMAPVIKQHGFVTRE